MKTIAKDVMPWALLLSGAIALALLVSIPMHQKIRAQNQTAKSITPYTIQYHGVTTGADGTRTPYDLLVAGKSNGDSISQDSSPNSPRIIRLVASGLAIAVAPTGSNVMTLGDGKPGALQTFGNNCEEFAGQSGDRKLILGFRTVKVVSTGQQETPDGKNSLTQTQESWLAPDLNCQHLDQRTTWTLNGQPDGATTETATWAIAGEPDAALFQLPENPVEVAPSVFYAAIGRPFNPNLEAIYNRQKAGRLRN